MREPGPRPGAIPIGTRVRVGQDCPWPERRGSVGTVVAPPADGTYPQPASWQALLLLDDDPLCATRQDAGVRWSCAMDAHHLEALGDG